MTSTKKEPVLVVLQLAGGNDALNTVVPYGNPKYFDHRNNVVVPEDQVLPINDQIGFNPNMEPMKKLYDEGHMAIVQGVGYPTGSRSHFRSMDIWHTCEPTKIGEEGWLGRVVRDLDPKSENVLTAVNFGRGLPRALVTPGVPAASVGDLETYGVLTGIDDADQRLKALDVFSKVYTPMIGQGAVNDYLAHTGLDALKGADILSSAPGMYSSTVEYGSDTVSQYMRNIVQTHLAGFGTRVLYTTAPFNSFDTHAGQLAAHTRLWSETSRAVGDFYDDLQEHNAGQDVLLLVFTEFGRRVKDNGSGTDHGAGGHCFIIGEQVKGGLYGEYPSLDADKLDDGDLQFNTDFRSVYSTILDKWMGLDAKPIVGGEFEQLAFV
ncbi:MAG: hypothetical protein CL696_06610 [Chloroflexi bacterium]|jgi:uncharacterized protein (DUF1501 family)|nr:hypothetical protein [Chloroflexota bacterium]MBL16156.1 hypothetical protein [Chloroflexota bacterium]MDP6497219.1 DUF1501 domain-containing protein [Dehalococcoidia bacterium]MQG10661.1 DUF1501 domain-containing protein [SAR202 cluster bacterium]MQG54313.1 DUF1501 domain-containing protein [SAR202 cluster bacterium]|tara:strand:- start:727 stop:1860 length:1134 start_codon:yes stop_codon:yes gene_type:complete